MIGFNYLGKLGQLGNQMFQYATVLGVAEKIGVSGSVSHITMKYWWMCWVTN